MKSETQNQKRTLEKGNPSAGSLGFSSDYPGAILQKPELIVS